MRTFVLNRIKDVSGISGTGIIAEGIEFSDKTVVTRWLRGTQSTVLWNSIDDLIKVNCHNGLTEIIWSGFHQIRQTRKGQCNCGSACTCYGYNCDCGCRDK